MSNEILISPGVLQRENDFTLRSPQPTQVGAAIIGPTVKGKNNIPTVVTSYSDYINKFGTTIISGSDSYTYMTSISAQNYFANGGTSLLVTKIGSGSWSSSTSNVSGSAGNAFVLETLSEGIIMNNSGSEFSNGALISGSSDNIRWEITNSNTGSGTFTLLIRRGDDNTKSKNILEQFSNLSLDPEAPNYIERIIGNQTFNVMGSGTSDVYIQSVGEYPNASNFVRVSNVTLKTPKYFNNEGQPKSQYTGSIPLNNSGSFSGGTGTYSSNSLFFENISNTNTQGVIANNYLDAILLLSNKDEYQFKIITTPGLIYSYNSHSTAMNNLLEIVENRGDALYIMDLVGYASNPTVITTEANNIDSSYAASYWPWVQMRDPDTSKLVWSPASVVIPGVFSYSDSIGEPWFAPAGLTRGGLTRVIQPERKISNSVRNVLYNGKINAISTFPGQGIVAFGQKTLQKANTSLNRINVRRLLIELKQFIGQVANTLVFEQNTIATRNSFLSQVNPFLDSVQQRQGLYAYEVIMDESNNTNDVIDRNELRGIIRIQPSITAEFIYLDYTILPTGVEFN
jgi:phage tail sheath protein FI